MSDLEHEAKETARKTLEVVLETPPILDDAFQIADLDQAKKLIHEMSYFLREMTGNPALALIFGETVFVSAALLGAVAHYVTCPNRQGQEQETPTWQPSKPFLH